jgi:hypothetical protein
MSRDGSSEKLAIGLYAVVEGINVDDVEFAENPNLVFVHTVSEYYLSHSTASGLGWLVTKFDKLER